MTRSARIVTLGVALFLAAAFGGTAAPPPNVSGQQTFRYDTFDDEQLWTNVLRLHEALRSVSPATALAVGLKVDAEALPRELVAALRAGQVDLTDPAVTIALLRLNAVVGVMGRANDLGELTSVGITCALCHSTVDNSLAAGIGSRLDGWPNRDLNVGAIMALSPLLDDPGWGPGRYDPRHQVFDGRNVVTRHEDMVPVLIPPAYGLKGVGFETYTGDGTISYWNSYVGVSQMGGKGNFSDPRIGLFISQQPDRVTPKLPALREYQLGLAAPAPPAGSFDAAAASRGERLFNGKADCARCHPAPTYTDVLNGPDARVPVLHDAEETGADPRYAARSATGRYRATPLRGIWQHPPYFHDGSAATLLAVVKHYDDVMRLNLSDRQKADLVEFLKSL